MSDQPAPELTFEEAVAQLDQVVRTLEDGTLGLEDALTAYEKGIGLLKSCYQQLRQAEQRILRLWGTDADGKPILESFEHKGAVEQDRPESRRRKS